MYVAFSKRISLACFAMQSAVLAMINPSIWLSASALQQNSVEQMSDLFVEHRYLSFKMRLNFFHITTLEHWNIAIQKAFVVAIGL